LVCAVVLLPAGAAEAAKCTQKGTGGVDVLKGTKKRDVLCGKGGDDVLIGKGGNDVLKGAAGNDILTGKAGKDSLAGGPGDDTLAGGKDDDKLKGQAGLDIAAFADSPTQTTVDLGAGTATGDGSDVLIAVENVIGSPFNDALTGDAAANELSAGDGDDKLSGGGGDDTLKGQGGIDSTSYAAVSGPVTADLRAGTVSGDGSDAISGIENLTGSPAADTITGDDADNMLDGGPGHDTVSFAGAPAGVDADLGFNGSTGDGTDTLIGFEDLTGSAHADKLAGDAAANVLIGGDGNDTLLGGAGNDQLKGEGGADTAGYAGATASITADLRAGTISGQGIDTLAGVENVTGSPQGDTLAGDGGNNVLDGAGGADTVSFAASPALIDSSLATGVTTGDGSDTVLRVENAIGSTHNDSIAGSAGGNAIAGGLGNDTLASGDGNDQISGEDGNDRLFGELDDDDISGGPGDDLLDGGTGVNDCDGGTGINTYAGNCDGTAPVLTAFAISPASVDTSGSQQTVNFTLSATDNSAGVDPTMSKVIVHAPAGMPTFEDQLQLVSGDELNGDYTAAITLPRYSAQGTWTVEVQLADQSANQVLLTTAQLAAAGRPSTFAQTGAGDTTGPALTSFTRSPASIDTSGANRTVDFDLDATDDLAGVDTANSKVIVHGPSGQPTFQTSLQSVGGSSYHATVTIPQYSAPGVWTIELLLLDNASNQTIKTTADLAAVPYPSTFTQTGAGDTIAPTLTLFDRTPAQINTAEVDQVVDFTLSATDDLAGINAAASKVVAVDPVSQPGGEGALTLVGGTPQNGDYTAAITIPQGSATGTWKIQVELVDKVGNVEVVTSAELAAAGFPATFENLAPGGA
jgi:hypothetical protein